MPNLPAAAPQLLEVAFKTTCNIRDQYERLPALIAIAHQVSSTEPEFLETVLSTAQDIGDGEYRARALTAIAAKLEGTRRTEILNAALSAADALQNMENRARAPRGHCSSIGGYGAHCNP